MNRKAMSIGMTASFFTSPDGREPKIGKAEFEEKPDCASTPEDMVVLAKEIIKRKELLAICSAWKGEFLGQRAGGPLEFKNSNRLLPGGPEACPGVDGLRTAYVKGDGYCSLTTCLRDGRRMVAVVAGFPTREGRDAFVAKLLDWGYSIKPKLGPTRPDEVPAGSK
jgi:D-alanyl-D-alanine carboxypeptidase